MRARVCARWGFSIRVWDFLRQNSSKWLWDLHCSLQPSSIKHLHVAVLALFRPAVESRTRRAAPGNNYYPTSIWQECISMREQKSVRIGVFLAICLLWAPLQETNFTLLCNFDQINLKPLLTKPSSGIIVGLWTVACKTVLHQRFFCPKITCAELSSGATKHTLLSGRKQIWGCIGWEDHKSTRYNAPHSNRAPILYTQNAHIGIKFGSDFTFFW